ncbi:non-ribosomal peptide synthetase [Actinophytocola algeriensis]|uniref:Nonribosomal peptide synthetase DhbF n=1 Tax=Actinophytocola algeriensis TaxID=1768010 RepID=A0A7W7VJL3_9PSEU|nr:non-ribosomal peptide synthetase [Actinophytocola algeriensis]MBB4912777.1 nonribosomal peptide synthetase DhbF [Actinophytocola algeriensis]MBE1473555.1 nonribosomal peptide synthetase DhbF [Actinophytocola algeriensis]
MRSFDASSAHKGLWLAQKVSADTMNHALTMWDVDGALDAAVMESAFRHVLDEAEVLRVSFVDEDSGLRLVPRDLGDWRPFFLDVSDAVDPERSAREALADMIRQPFDLEHDLLFRLGVVTLSAARSLVVIAYHHLISDGYGVGGLLSRRLAEVYTALTRGAAVPELPHPWDTGSFAAGATEYLASQRFADDKEFWRDYLKDAPPPAQVPRVALSDAARVALSEPMGSADRWSELADAIGVVSRTVTVPRAEADAWTEVATSTGMWMSSMLTAAAAVYFRHRCDHPEFLLSLAVGNRVGVASRTPGLAVNVVPVRVRVPLDATFAEIAEAVGDQTYEIFDHTACHYSDIQQASGTVLSGRGSFGAVMNVVGFAEQLHFAGSPARSFGGINGAFNELSISVGTDGSADSDLYFRLDAPSGLYSRAELGFISADLVAFVRTVMAADPRLPVGAIDVVSGAERDVVLTAPNDTDVPLPELTVSELFSRQVERAPGADAIVSWGSAVSYRELDERSTRIAGSLRRRGVGAEAVVAVALPRSVDLAVALLGVVKAGGAYLPVDPTCPVEQIMPVVGDCSVRALLTDAATAEELSAELGVPAIVFGELRSDTADDGAREVPVPSHQDNLMAVMYGSGSSGTATGAAVTHRNMLRLVMDRRWRDGGHGAVLWHSPHTSDALALELWVPLLNGGRVVVAPPGRLDVDDLAESRTADDVSTVWLSAELFSSVAAERPERLAGLREVWTGGDRVSSTAVRRVRAACPELTIVNGHGPMESTVFAACHGADAARPGMIGRPMDNTALYVLGPGLAPVPVGVTGDLYVAGPGVVRGYPGRPGRTAERFVPCPFGPAGGRMYRTGDRVRWAADGDDVARLEYVGRVDARAEVRGFGVDVAEVEEALSEHPRLVRSVVVGGEDPAGRRCLVAYVVPVSGEAVDDEAGPSGDELRRFTVGRLPEFLVPSVFTVLEHLPLTPGGRVDLASLPEPEFGGRQYRAPRNDTERVLAEAFADVLELDQVGIDDDFFDLGGNSLRAIRLVGLIRSELDQEVSIRTLFAVRTVTGLSDMWNNLAKSSRPALRRKTRDGQVL